jgi:anti-sigma-K factor RskA
MGADAPLQTAERKEWDTVDILSDPGAFDGDCQDVVELVTEYLEGTLPAGVRPAFEAHLRECPDCVEIVEQFRATIAAVGAVHHPSLPSSTQRRLVDAFRDLIRRPGDAAGDDPGG